MKMLTNLALLLTLSMTWAAGFVFIKFMEGAFPPVMIAAGRATLAVSVMLIYCLSTHQSLKPALRHPVKMLILGLTGPVALWSAIAFGEEQVGPGLASLLSCVSPLAAVVLTALPPISKHVRWPAWLGLLIATAGLILAVGPDQLIDHHTTLLGVAIITAGFVSFGLYCVLGEHLTRGLKPAPAATVSMFISAAVLWALTCTFESPRHASPDSKDWLSMIALGVVSSAIPYLIILHLTRRAGSVFTSLFGYLLPIFGLAAGWLVFGDVPPWTLYLGAPIALIGMGVLQTTQARHTAQ